MRKVFLVIFLLVNILLTTQAKAASQPLENTNKIVDHLTWSVKNNFLGLKNQGQWEVYIKNAQNTIKLIPDKESREKSQLVAKIDKIDLLVKAIARINHVEKSMEVNFHGIKNSKQWREYIEFAEKSLERIDKEEFSSQYEELVARKDVCKDILEEIEKKFYGQYNEALEKYLYARENILLGEAEKAYDMAKLLGTCEESITLKSKCERFIEEIKNVAIDIDSVSIKEDVFDDDTANQELKLIVNDDVISKDFIKSSGYSIEFKAYNSSGEKVDIFEDKSFGKLKSKIAKDTYRLTATLSKNGQDYISSLVLIDVVNLDGVVTSIEDYTIENFGTNTQTKFLVVGERAKISSLDITLDNDTFKIFNDYIFKLDNSDVIEIENGFLKAKKAGKTNLKVYYGNISKTFELEVKEGKREVNSLDVKDEFNIITGKTLQSKIRIYDQYLDAINDEDLVVTIENSSQLKWADIDMEQNGEGTLVITAGDKKGLSKIYIRTKEGKLLKTLNVTITEVNNVDRTQVEVNQSMDERYSKNFSIYEESSYKNKYINLYLAQYNSEGVFNGKVNLKGYTVKYDEKTLDISDQEDGVFKDIDNFTVSAKRAGATDIYIFYPNGAYAYKVTLNVISLNTGIESINWKNINSVGYAGVKVNIHSLVECEQSGNDDILKGIVLKENTSYKIRLSKGVSSDNSPIKKGYIYMDRDSNGLYSGGDILLGEITAKVLDDETSSLYEMDIYEGITTKKGDELTIFFNLNVFDNIEEDLKTMLENKYIKVNVN